MKRAGIALMLFLSTSLFAEFRTITYLSSDYLFDGSLSLTVGEVALFKLTDTLQTGLKARYEQQDAWWRGLGGPCIVVVAAKNFYYEVFYGLGYDADGSFSHEGTLELTIETDTYLISGGVKADYYQESGFFYIIPSAGCSWSFTDWYALKIKAFSSFDSDNATSVSTLFNNEFKASQNLSFQLGVSGGYTWNPSGNIWTTSGLGNCKINFTKTASTALTAELLMKDFLPIGLRGVLTVDLKF